MRRTQSATAFRMVAFRRQIRCKSRQSRPGLSDQSVELWHVRENLWVNEISPASRRQNRHHYRGETVEIAIPGSILGSYSEEFSLTTDPVRETPVTAKGKLFSFDWFVQIELDVPWAKDPEVRPEERDGKGTITSSLGHVLFYAS